MAIVMPALSLNVCDICAKKFHNFDIENDGQGRVERDLHHSIGNVRFHVSEFFRISATWEHMFNQTGYAHTHTNTNGQQETAVITIDKLA